MYTQKQIIQYTIYSWYRSRVLFSDDDGYIVMEGARKKNCESNLVYYLYLWLVKCVKAIHSHECAKHQPFFINETTNWSDSLNLISVHWRWSLLTITDYSNGSSDDTMSYWDSILSVLQVPWFIFSIFFVPLWLVWVTECVYLFRPLFDKHAISKSINSNNWV